MSYATGSMQGWKESMEDTHYVDIEMTKKQSIFALFDGHGGSEVSNYARDNFVNLQMKKELTKSLI